ncbi:hypothetical protein [Gordonia sp. (in: high G+C Gram-positive bacteria)]|uniref:hypothetical protein n=1 Tax=Gordonia sp. (in: high G+C Gram-positive bacteria) TaxID=84139 RepID=UPI0039E71209
MTEQREPQQSAPTFPPPPSYPPPGAYPPPGPQQPRGKGSAGIIVAVLAAVVVLLAALGVGGYLGYRALAGDHCDSVGTAAAGYVTAVSSLDPDTTKEAYLARIRDRSTPKLYAKVRDTADALFTMRDKNPTAAQSRTDAKVLHESVADCTKKSATVTLTVANTAHRPGAITEDSQRMVVTVDMTWSDGRWLADAMSTK